MGGKDNGGRRGGETLERPEVWIETQQPHQVYFHQPRTKKDTTLASPGDGVQSRKKGKVPPVSENTGEKHGQFPGKTLNPWGKGGALGLNQSSARSGRTLDMGR